MNKQEIFDKVYKAILAQGQKSLRTFPDRDPSCAYRDPQGRKCAIGHLIPDELYQKEMEDMTIYGVLQEFPELKEFLDVQCDEDRKFLFLLQYCHDRPSDENFIEDFKEGMTTLATKHGLNTEADSR